MINSQFLEYAITIQKKKKIERKINIEDRDSWIKGYLKKDREIGYLKIQWLPIRCNKIIVLVFNNKKKLNNNAENTFKQISMNWFTFRSK